ncbi:carbohydrate ABC transporter permease [Lacrimispora celerecrescens]|uniref:Raffinose/stachyose/melibiose transport system permease protein n=1 Tax=[Clostridium] celerecrescens 18A TaxID=1286362 RepID=A0A2M8Z9C1_9FIRM|nr:sugar ABC transporter permease [Lacrimispora celerecrescens]PJJ30042.1 raffinose/stachyose/melibiose transport system permease protein [[Clostridium] celerecrescens 18A]
MKSKRQRTAILFLLPAVVLLICFMIYPLGKTIYYSFTAWYNFSAVQTFIGLKNYKDLIRDPVVRTALRNTAILMAGVLLFQIGFALILAILVDGVRHCFKFFRTIYFFPIVISATAIGLMFTLIYKYEYGLLNYFITLFGGEKQVWINERTSIYLALIPVVWQYVGFYFVIFLTGISNISSDIYESAMLDGIRPVQKAVYITVPMLRSVLTSSIVLVVSGCFKVFDIIFMVTNGGPLDSSQLLSTYMYQKAFARGNGGYASSIAIVMIVLGVAVTSVLRKMLQGGEEDA